MNDVENKQVYIVSLGCPKNQVDSEYLLASLSEKGYTVTDEPGDAGVVLVNTCAFIKSAVEESVETVLELAEYKDSGSAWAVVVTGCLPQRYRESLERSLPEVDLFCGTGEVELLAELLEGLAKGKTYEGRKLASPGYVPDGGGTRLQAAPFYRAYLKVSEGCSRVCSFCLIPSLRGPQQSRSITSIMSEATALVDAGVKELILVAQDSTGYGQDLKKQPSLPQLLRALSGLPSLEWIRIMYAYPSGITDELVQTMADEPKICSYLDLPLQHISPRLLKNMKRDDGVDIKKLISVLRKDVPNISLRTTFMVGFPGETEADFDMLLDFVEEASFEHMGVFKFSPEEGSVAAKMKNQVPQQLKENRRRKLMALQRRISKEKNRELIGQTMPVLVEGLSPETDLLLVGRTQGQAPDVDGRVFINKGIASAGEIRPITITDSHDYDLVGEPASDD